MRFKRAIYFFLCLIGLYFVGCDIRMERLKPHYKGVDPKLVPYVNQWLDLAQKHGLSFENKVTVGFCTINHGRTIGLSWYGRTFHEIDIDIPFWTTASETSRKTLIFHELVHSYCNREHDYAENKDYLDRGGSRKDYPKGEGFFEDDCPTSIMFPSILSDRCVNAHKDFYLDEMFARCEPY